MINKSRYIILLIYYKTTVNTLKTLLNTLSTCSNITI